MKIVVILPSWVGDTAMATPALRALKQRYPGAQLIGLGRAAPIELLRPLGWFDQLIDHGRTSKQRLRTARDLRSQKIDLAISFPASEIAALMAFVSGAKRRIGFDRGVTKWLWHERQAHPRDVPHEQRPAEIDRFLELTARLGCETHDRRMELCTSDEGERLSDHYLQRTGLAALERLVVVNSSGAVAESKLWHTPHLIQLCRDLAKAPDTGVLIHCGPGERDATREITRECDSPRVHSMADWPDLPLHLSVSILNRASVVVSTDSGPRHIAVAMNRPVVSLFGSTNVEPTRTFNLPEVIVQEPMACRPCWKKQCPLGHHQCMRAVTPERVKAAVDRILAAQRISAA